MGTFTDMKSPILKPILGRNFVPSIIDRKFAFFGKCDENVRFCFRNPKRHILAWNDVFWHIDRQNRRSGLRDSELEEPQKLAEWTFGRQLRICGAAKFHNMVMKFCSTVDNRDIVTHANFGDDGFTRFGMAGGRISRFSIDFRHRTYNRENHYRAVVCALPALVRKWNRHQRHLTVYCWSSATVPGRSLQQASSLLLGRVIDKEPSGRELVVCTFGSSCIVWFCWLIAALHTRYSEPQSRLDSTRW